MLRFRLVVVVAMSAMALAPVRTSAATRVVRVDSDGRAVGTVPAIRSGDRVAIELVEFPAAPRPPWAIQYRFHEEPDDYLENPTPQPCPQRPMAPSIGVTYSCPFVKSAILAPPKGSHFVSYSLLVADMPNNRWNARKLGWLVLGRGRKSVTYALRSLPRSAQPFHVERLGDYPVITDEDLLYAVIVDAKKGQFHFDLSFNAAQGSIANPAPIRPSFAPGSDARPMPPPPLPEHEALGVFTDDAYADVVLAFGQKFRGADVIKVTISTEMEVVTKNSRTEKDDGATTQTSTELTTERQVVKLLDNVEYPQVHTRYAYNIATGLIVSSLRRPSYIKVQTVAGAAAADNRYRTETTRGGPTVEPVAALSFYLRRVDIQVPLTWKERAIPAPTLGFSLKNPTEDVFLGLSHELVRNTQVFYGWHVGKIDVLGPEGPLEDHFSSVTTVKRFKSGFFLGITLNIGGIKDMILK